MARGKKGRKKRRQQDSMLSHGVFAILLITFAIITFLSFFGNAGTVGVILDEVVDDGMHTYTFSDLPDAFGEGFGGYQELESGVYLFVMETEDRIKSKKFTIIK